MATELLTDDDLLGIQARLDNMLWINVAEWYHPDVSRLLAEVRLLRALLAQAVHPPAP